jgi:hypothetical protein
VRRGLTIAALVLAACNLQQGTPSPLPTPDTPSIEFLSPVNGSTVYEGTDLTIDLVARDNGEGIARVQLLVDDLPHQEGAPVNTIAVPTFTVTMNWLAEGTGFHSLTAVAYRTDGTASPPTMISIQVVERTPIS